ncbi:hypothetical protein [uncultured Paraglaciecola sp.]|uniref:hypothetical protein n=1 Tax=uncultured Paraglaciecola sp. TaxID=1765024 RepID=UPI002614E9ED|nr:hypothetical protein [uncultured Paraglaciecola sp.]
MPSQQTPQHGDSIVDAEGRPTQPFQSFLDDVGDLGLAVQLPKYTVAGVPNAAKFEGHAIYVSNGALGSPIMAFSDGTDWLRSDTMLPISA